MPSYTGTIRCSHCYEEGHNKRKCPRLTQEIKDTYETQRRLAERYRSGEYDHKLRPGTDDERLDGSAALLLTLLQHIGLDASWEALGRKGHL